MTLSKFIDEVNKGMLVQAGGRSHGHLIEGFARLDKKDLMSVTAEAFNQEVFEPTVKWADAMEQVKEALDKKVSKYSEDEERDDHGRWSGGGSTDSTGKDVRVSEGYNTTKEEIRDADKKLNERIDALEQKGEDSPDNHEYAALTHIATATDARLNTPLSEAKNVRTAFVFNSKGDVVAGGVMRISGKTAEIENVGAVEQGTGRHVVSSLIQQAKERGVSEVRLTSTARSFYEGMGFQHTTGSTMVMHLKMAKASAHDTRRAVIHPGRSLPHTVLAFHHFEKVMLDQFRGMRKKIRRLLMKHFAKAEDPTTLFKADDEEELLKQMQKSINENWKTIADETWQDFEAAALAGVAQGAVQLELDNHKLISKTNEQAKEWANMRSAELVGMRRTDTGRLVKNPDARWAISDTTREDLRKAISRIFATEDVNMAQAEKEIEDAGIFDDKRATMIARTETSRAQALSNLNVWKESGEVEKVSWQLSSDHDLDDICSDNADESPYNIDEVPEFPAHPNCMCNLVLETLKGEE